MPFPDGNNGTMMIPMTSADEVCDAHRTACYHSGREVDESICESWRDIEERLKK